MKKRIKLISGKDISDVAEKWKSQYLREGKWAQTISGDTGVTYEKIVEAKGNPDKIEAIIGNPSWTNHFCCSCNEFFRVGVEMLEPDYETTPTFCARCINLAAAMLKENGSGPEMDPQS